MKETLEMVAEYTEADYDLCFLMNEISIRT